MFGVPFVKSLEDRLCAGSHSCSELPCYGLTPKPGRLPFVRTHTLSSLGHSLERVPSKDLQGPFGKTSRLLKSGTPKPDFGFPFGFPINQTKKDRVPTPEKEQNSAFPLVSL